MREVRVGKIDLDTVGAAYLLEVTREDNVEVLRGEATSEDLANSDVICIEVGGSGQIQLNNWDHHRDGGPKASATYQIWSEERNFHLYDLVRYINQMDTEGPQSFESYGHVEFPTLSDVFAGMLLTERDPVEQLHKGIELLKLIMGSEINLYGTISIRKFDSYARAKAENNRQIARAVKNAQWDTTSKGLKLGYLETKFFGAPGALYGNGAQVVVAFNPDFNGVRKFTVAGNNVKVDIVKPFLNELESGWGGPPTGTIIGSPREGSKLSLEEVVKIVKTTL